MTDKLEAKVSEKMESCYNPFCIFDHDMGRVQVSSYMEPKPYHQEQEYHVRCQCGSKGPYKPTQAEAIAAWNRRAEPSGWREALEGLRQSHLQVDDCWYSCPKADCCNDERPKDKCTCGADEFNAKLEAILALLPAPPSDEGR